MVAALRARLCWVALLGCLRTAAAAAAASTRPFAAAASDLKALMLLLLSKEAAARPCARLRPAPERRMVRGALGASLKRSGRGSGPFRSFSVRAKLLPTCR